MLFASLCFIPALLSVIAAEITVAIYGGGVASATLAQALKNYGRINVQYYDPNLNLTPTSFRLLGLSPKTWTALDLVGPEAGGVINRAGWYPEDPSIVIMVRFALYKALSPYVFASAFLLTATTSRAKVPTPAKLY